MKKLSSVTRIINIATTCLVATLLSAATMPTDVSNIANSIKITAVTEKKTEKAKVPTQNLKSKKITHQKLPKNIADLVDPTRPPDAVISPTKSLFTTGAMQLNAIFFYPDNQAAIINGQLVRSGDSVGEYTIINIHRDTVELIGIEGKDLKLRMFPQIKTYHDMKGK